METLKQLRRWPAPLVVLTVIALLGRAGVVGAAAGEAADPTGDGGSGPDIVKVYWSESGTNGSQPANVTLGFEVAAATLSNADSESHWDFDLNNDGTASEACGDIVTFGSTFQFELFKDCGQETTATVPASHPTGGANKVEFTLTVADLREAGLPQSGTAYRFRLKSTVSLAGGDEVPDSATALLTHTFGGSLATATPTPSPTGSGSPTPTPTKTPTPAPTGSASPSPTGSATPSPTPCPSASPTPTASPSASPSPSPTATASPTVSPSASPTPTVSPTPTATACPHETVTGTPSKTNVAPGDEVAISGNGFAVSTKLDITFQSTPKALGSITASTSGAFSTTVKIPTDATAGAHHIVVAGANTRGGTRTMMFPVTVTTSGSTTGGTTSGDDTDSVAQVSGSTSNPTSLPRTGIGIALLFGIALTILLGGMTGMSEARTRRRSAMAAGPTVEDR